MPPGVYDYVNFANTPQVIQLNPIIEGLLNTLNKGQPYCTQGKLR